MWSAASGWRMLPDVPVAPILTADPAACTARQPRLVVRVAPDGRVFHAGPSRQMNWISTTGNGASPRPACARDSADAMNGNAVMYDTGKILTVGGATAYEDADATDRAYAIDINNGVTVRRVRDWPYARPSPAASRCRTARCWWSAAAHPESVL